MHNQKKKKFLLMAISSICIIYLFKDSFSRYSFNNVWNYYLESQKFFFTSDNLLDDQVNTDTFWDGGSVSFNLKNFSNSDLISDKDITYQVTCEVIDGDEECTINGSGNNTVTGVLSVSARCVNNEDEEEEEVDLSSMNKTECEVAGYTWEKSLVTNNLYFDIESDDEIDEVSVRITASSTAPFRKTITGIFNLINNGSSSGIVDTTINHYETYDELIITNTSDTGKCVTVEFDTSKRIVDINNHMTILSTDNDDYVETFGLEIAALSNQKIIFYSKDHLTNFSDIVVNEEEC